MNQKNLLIICVTAVICISIISVTAIMITANNPTSNDTTNVTANTTLNDSNDTNTTTTQTTKKSTSKKSKVREEDKITSDGWNPKEHEVNREYVGDGIERVDYDDGYHRWVDKDGNILSYGY